MKIEIRIVLGTAFSLGLLLILGWVALAAVIARPIGGMLSDRIPPKIVVLTSLAGTGLIVDSSTA